MKGNGSILVFMLLLCAAGAYAGYKLGVGAEVDRRDAGSDEAVMKGALGGSKTARGSSHRKASLSAEEVGELLVRAGRSRDEDAWSTAGNALPHLKKDELLQVLAKLTEIKPMRARQEMLRPVLDALARLDPPLAMQEAERLARGHWLHQVQSTVLRRWAKANPVLALEEANRLARESGHRIHYYSAVIGVWARDDFHGAAAAVKGLDNDMARNSALKSLAQVVGEDPEHRGSLLSFAKMFSTSYEQDNFLAAAVEHWGRDESLADMERWIETQELDAALRARLFRAVAQGVGHDDPSRSAQWLLARSTPESKAADLETVVTNWMLTEPQACGDWLENHLGGPDADLAVGAYSIHLSRRKPREALAWAERIEDDALRLRSYERIVHSMGPIPVEVVRTRLEEVGLDEELVARLLEARDVE